MRETQYPFQKEYFSVCGQYITSQIVRFNSENDPMISLIQIQIKSQVLFKTKEEAIAFRDKKPFVFNSKKATFDDFKVRNDKDRQLLNVLKDYVVKEKYKDEKQNGLFLIGNVGTGKSFAMECIYTAIKTKRERAYYRNVNDIIEEVKDTFENEYTEQQVIEKYQKTPILFLDDLGSEKDSEFTKNVIYKIINYRYNNNLPTIISSNYSKEDLRKNSDLELERIVSRIQDNALTIIFDGESKRNNATLKI